MHLTCSGAISLAKRNACSRSSANVAACRILKTYFGSVPGAPLLCILYLMFGTWVLFRPIANFAGESSPGDSHTSHRMEQEICRPTAWRGISRDFQSSDRHEQLNPNSHTERLARSTAATPARDCNRIRASACVRSQFPRAVILPKVRRARAAHAASP